MIDTSDSMQINDRTRKSWSQEEDNILTKLVKKYGVKRWTDISKAMVDLFQITSKSGKQCRQRWVNHLDPKINKQKWTMEEERKIFDAHKIYGNKWKNIAKQLNNRTDNSIKNHFYSILRKGLRRLNKMIGDRKSTEKVKEIRTSVLSKLDKLDQSQIEQSKRINVFSIYELLFQFSSMKLGNISEKNLTLDLKNDFKEMINHLMSLSSQQKINKQKNIALNKDKKNRKNSAGKSQISEYLMEDEHQSQEEEIQEDKQNQVCINTNLTIVENQNKFLVPLQIPQRSKENQQNEKYFTDEKTSQKAHSFINMIQQTPQKNIVSRINSEKFQLPELVDSQKGDDYNFNIFPSITINLEQPISFTNSNDFNLNCFNKSPLFSSHRMADHFNIRTPRVPSPGAFNFCGISTAQSLGNYASLANKEVNQSKVGAKFDNQLDKIVEQLRSNIDANCNTGALTGLRVNSSRNSCLDPTLKASSSGIFLTPRSGSGRVH